VSYKDEYGREMPEKYLTFLLHTDNDIDNNAVLTLPQIAPLYRKYLESRLQGHAVVFSMWHVNDKGESTGCVLRFSSREGAYTQRNPVIEEILTKLAQDEAE
jgi:hypothetical protein